LQLLKMIWSTHSTSASKRQNTLVFDATGTGHRANYVRTLAGALEADGLIGEPRFHMREILSYPIMLFSTFETRPAQFALWTAFRSLLGKKTILLLLRAKITDRGNRQLKTCVHLFLAALPGVRLLSILPIAESPHLVGRAYEVQDPEFWDIAAEEKMSVSAKLSEDLLAKAAGRTIILCAGGISGDKGMVFLSEMMMSPEWIADKYLVCSIGKVSDSAREDVNKIQSLGGYVVDRYVTDAELVSVFQHANFTWCCYPPERDMSSGIFGRSCQFGCWPLVRAGSILERIAASYGIGSALPWGDADAATFILTTSEPHDFVMNSRREENIERLRSVVYDREPEFVDLLAGPKRDNWGY
jgi:hypothetical protein